ncbi:MAG: UDP-N-acetylmuramoyl-tripeptide--D-alanyl-D-alanine ligase [Butyrivibrio sp.]|nr:UDP-N-acetylmuramoyl-tripeptide--D-alanyl-D-alanine ligase [Butyrivibrio sp.]
MAAIFIIFSIVYLWATVLGLRYYTHMLQLSSYQFQGYFRFLKTIVTKYGLHAGAAATLIGAGLFECMEPLEGIDMHRTAAACFILSAVFLVMMAIMYIPGKAKKKFVVTKRVQRLFITYAALFVIFVLVAVCCSAASSGGKEGKFAVAAVFAAVYIGLLPLVVALSNLINKPVENRINRYYIDDAKRILNEHSGLRIIGVTGSYGKTSVKYYLTTLLSEKYRVLMTPESYNTPMGIVRTIREKLMPTHEIFVCEMGARHLHDIKEITDIVHPDDGILTSIGYQHLETFHSLENIVSTKYELLDAVDEKEKAENAGKGKHLKFANGDNEIIRENMKYSDAITYGVSEGCDYKVSDISVTGAGTTFNVTSPEGETSEFSTKLVGRHNVENIAGAIAVAASFGVPMNKLRMAVRRIQPVPHRLELVRHGAVSILDDAYNSNPNGAKVALETLALFENSVKVLVTPGMVELGAKEDEYNEAFGKQAAEVCDYIILVGEKQTHAIKKGVLGAGFAEDKLFVKNSLTEATQLMYELEAGREKVILLENDLPDNYT